MSKKKLSYGERIAALAGLGVEGDDFPEDLDEETGAKVVEEYESEEEEATKVGSKKQVKRSSLRAKNVKLLDELDERYAGAKTSRKKLQLVTAVKDGEVQRLENRNVEVEDESSDEGDEVESESDIEDGSEDELPENGGLVSNNEGEDSEEDEEDDDEESSDDDEDEDDVDEGDMFEMGSGEEKEFGGSDGVSDDEDDMKTMSSASSNAEKSKATQNQLRMWDALLEVRIRMQRMLLEANKLPQLSLLNEVVKTNNVPKISSSSEKCLGAVRDLLTNLTSLQEFLTSQNPEVSKSLGRKRKAADPEEEDPMNEEITSSEDEKESGDEDKAAVVEDKGKSDINSSATKNGKPKKKKQKLADLELHIKTQFEQFVPYRNETIQKWNEKTQLSFGKYGKKTHEISTLKQIEHLLSNKEKLLKRTHVKRSAYQTIGKQQQTEDTQDDSDHEIFDDDDFYHQLLRELIERKTSNVSDPVQLSRHWLELQKMRSKLKKKVDTKASKGRKIRYDVHSKLINFMAPEDNCAMSDNAIKELINSLFGKLL